MGRGAGNYETDNRSPGKAGLKFPVLKIILFVCGVFILNILYFSFWHQAGPSQTATLAPGDLKLMYLAEGVLVRDEAVITSPANGQLNILVQEGERVRAGDSIAEVKTLEGDTGASVRTALIRAPRTGVVIYRTDGLEGVLNPGQVDILEIAGIKLKADENAGRDHGKGGKCDKGQPVMKIVDNLSPVVICLEVPEGFPADRIKKGGIISMIWESSQFTGRIAEVRDYRGRPQVVVQALNYPGGFLHRRKMVLGLEGGTAAGCIVSTRSLVEKEGQVGLYIMSKRQVKWVPVKIEGVVDDRAAVSGPGVTPGTHYVVNPRWLFTKV